MTRKGATTKFHKKYLGFLIGIILVIPLVIFIVWAQPWKPHYFFDQFSCPQLLSMNATAERRGIPLDDIEKVRELIEEKDCTSWTLQD